jgi:predicted alpha-1,6-mannanase (GH76 family)
VSPWAERAARAERAVVGRHVRRLWGLPGTALGRSGWPPNARQRLHASPWNYWWQAHLVDCLVDAQLRAPEAHRGALIGRLVRSVWLRNRCRWTNVYYDDVAWLVLALQRVASVTARDTNDALRPMFAQLRAGRTDDGGGGIWWRRGDRFKNTPTNGPAAIAHARAGEPERARELVEWLDSRLVDPVTGLVWDGVRLDSGEIVTDVFTYCQGAFLGACLETGALARAERTVHAVAAHCAPGGVLRGQGGWDGGLFAGILARYLALAVVRLPAGVATDIARRLVLDSAQACWDNATSAPLGPLFGPEWSEPAPSMSELDSGSARDLSVQLGAWMLLEAAATMSPKGQFNSRRTGGA